MSRPRRPNFTAREKVAILREVLLERRPVSEVCERHHLQPSQFYSWQKQLFENGDAAFGRDRAGEQERAEREIALLKVRLAGKDEVIADISQEYVRLKKVLGAP
jgi:transposase-like protein